ncbi:MAG: HK97 family phage prohead protease, partial [Pirellulales bacterium]
EVYKINDLKLYEVSVVTVGANSETEVLAVKQVPAVTDRLIAEVKAGRVLSAKNESDVRNAHQALGRVLSVLDGTPNDEQKASESGPSCQANDDTETKSADLADVSEESPREASPTPSVDRSAYIDAILGEIFAEVA